LPVGPASDRGDQLGTTRHARCRTTCVSVHASYGRKPTEQ
jgi:hypothetical protein